MKRILLVLGVLVLGAVVAGQVQAQDNPYLGTWKLNNAKSKSDPTPLPKSMTRTVTAEGKMVKYSYEGVGADGSAVAYSFSVAYDGKDYPVTGAGMPGGADSIAIKRVGTHNATAVLKKGGKEVGTSASEVSKDGKSTHVKGSGKTLEGKAFSSDLNFDKQ